MIHPDVKSFAIDVSSDESDESSDEEEQDIFNKGTGDRKVAHDKPFKAS